MYGAANGLLVDMFDSVRDYFAVFYDLSQRAAISIEHQARDLEGLFLETKSKKILDCASGTGLPSLELQRRGWNVTCFDGDETMVAMYNKRAREMGVNSECRQLLWQHTADLLQSQYDYVLCLGNSLIYNNSWLGQNPTGDYAVYDEIFTNFRQIVRIGGFLHIDAPKIVRSIPKSNVTAFIDLRTAESTTIPTKHSVLVSVNEVVHELRGTRYWDCQITVDTLDGAPKQSYSFVRHSAKLTLIDFKSMLAAFGFGNFRELPPESGRPTHGAILAQRLC